MKSKQRVFPSHCFASVWQREIDRLVSQHVVVNAIEATVAMVNQVNGAPLHVAVECVSVR